MPDRKARAEAIAKLQRLALEVQAQNTDLTLEEADAIADEISRAAMDQLVAKGLVRFERLEDERDEDESNDPH